MGRESPEGSFSVDEVAPNLFVGSEPSGSVAELFRSMDLDLVINLSESNADRGRGVVPPEGRQYVWLPLPDGVEIERTPAVRSTVRHALAVLRDGGRVLVHCREGYLRSVQFAGMLVERVTRYESTDAVAAVAETRLGVSPYLNVNWQRPAHLRRRRWRAAGVAAAAAAVIAIAVNASVVREPRGFGATGAEANPQRPVVSSPVQGPVRNGPGPTHRIRRGGTPTTSARIQRTTASGGTRPTPPGTLVTSSSLARSGPSSSPAAPSSPKQNPKGGPKSGSHPGKANGPKQGHGQHGSHRSGPKQHALHRTPKQHPAKSRGQTRGRPA